MSSSGLAVRAVLTMDNTGLVGAANESVVSLDKLKTTAAETGAAGVEMGSGIETATVATDGLARSSALAASVGQAVGNARKQEVANLVQMASASSAASRSLSTITAAEQAYNATVTRAGEARKAGTITEQAYATVVAGATAKLALARAGLNEFGKGAEEAEAHTEHLTHEVMHVGRELGISREQVMLFRGSFGALGELADLLGPIGLIAVGIAAVAVAAGAFAVAMEKAQEESQKFEAELAGIGRMSGVTSAQVAHAAEVTASATGESIATTEKWAETYAKTGRIAGEVLVGLTAMTERYAEATGQNAEQASEDLAKSFADPKKGAEELNDKLGILNATQLKRIQQLDAEGDRVGAQKILYASLDKALDTSASHVRELAAAWDTVWTAASNAWHQQMVAAGGGTLAEQLAQAKKVLANDTAAAGAVPGGTWYWRAQIAADQKAVDDLTASLAKSTAESNKNSAAATANAASVKGNALAREVDPDAFVLPDLQGKLATLKAGKDAAESMHESAETIAQDSQAYQAVADAIGRVTDATGKYIPQATRDHQIAQLQVEAARAQSAAEKGAAETKIKLLEAGSKLITNQQALTQAQDAGAVATAKASHASDELRKSIVSQVVDLSQKVELQHQEADIEAQVAAAAGLSADERRKVNDEIEVYKANAPFDLAITRAKKAGFDDLASSLVTLKQKNEDYLRTTQEEKAQAASIEEIKQAYAGLSGQFADVAAQYAQAVADAKKWRDEKLFEIEGRDDFEQQADMIDAIFKDRIDKAFTDSLANARDWQSGISSALHGLNTDLDNFAKRSADATKSLSDEFEQSFIDGVSGSENVLQDFLTFFLKMLAKMIYETYMAKIMNGFAGDIVGALGSAFGVPTAGGGGTTTTLTGETVPVGHQGLVAGGTAVDSRTVSASTFSGAPRFHTGISRIKGLQPGEVPAILKEGERVYTEQQANAVDDALERPIVVRLPESMFPRNQASADAVREQVSQTAIRESASVIDFLAHKAGRDAAVHREITNGGSATAVPIAALHTQPLAIHLPDHVAGGSAGGFEPMQVQVTVHNLDGQTSRAKMSPNGNGGMNLDVIVDQIENRMSQRVQQGNGVFGRMLQQTFDLKRKVS